MGTLAWHLPRVRHAAMNRHPIIRVGKWSGVLLCVLMLLASSLTRFRGVGYFAQRGQVVLMAGGLVIDKQHAPVDERGHRLIDPKIPNRPFSQRLRGEFMPPSVSPRLIWIPLGLPLVFTATGFLFWLDRRLRRVPEGHCHGCGYNLWGNTSGVCSECGKEYERAASPARPQVDQDE